MIFDSILIERVPFKSSKENQKSKSDSKVIALWKNFIFAAKQNISNFGTRFWLNNFLRIYIYIIFFFFIENASDTGSLWSFVKFLSRDFFFRTVIFFFSRTSGYPCISNLLITLLITSRSTQLALVCVCVNCGRVVRNWFFF